MSKRLAAALLASLTFAAVLAVVPLASPAAAHEQTTTKQYCAYDPFAGQQCWNETVSVAHHHPPANQTCPAGTTGTPPNCLPIPPTNDPAPGTDTGDGNDPDPDPDPEEDGSGSGTGTDEDGSGSGSGTDNSGSGSGSGTDTDNSGSGSGSGTDTDNGGGTGTGTGTGTTDKKCPEGKTGTPPNCTDLQTATYTVKPCTLVQEPLEVVQRHRHPLGDSTTDGDCHRHDISHCPAGQTETGGHGSQDCREDDSPDTIFTRIQHLFELNGKAVLDAVIETLRNEAADQLTGLDIDWENFATDGDAQQKLLDMLNPVLKQNNIEVYTINDMKNLWADIGRYGRAGAAGAACYAAVEATMAKLTKGKSLKKEARHAAAAMASAVCAVGPELVPVPETNDDSSGDDTGSTPSTPSTPAEWDKAVDEAEQKWRRNEIDGDELHRLQNLRDCAYNHPWATNCP
ncbi:MAG: hypothetical protein F4155_07600 [Acidimicrobiales bacterium]|nr:hypothetical protein [Acidimicrobiales bacterium]